VPVGLHDPADQEDDVPTYAYACTACGHRFEVQQSFSDASLTDCPECQGKLRKLFNTVGIVFKGSGFYRTDSRTPAAPGSSSAEGAPKPAETSSSQSSSQSSSPSSSPSSSGGSGESKSSVPAA
jgi:putative FmdB family regulatory protein